MPFDFMEFYEFIFSSFWIWLGTWLLIGAIAVGLSGVALIKITK